MWLQFIAGLRNWQNFSYDDKMKFTYKIYDLDGSGFIEPSELVRSTSCISEMHSLSCFQAWRSEPSLAFGTHPHCVGRQHVWLTPTVRGEIKARWSVSFEKS